MSYEIHLKAYKPSIYTKWQTPNLSFKRNNKSFGDPSNEVRPHSCKC